MEPANKTALFNIAPVTLQEATLISDASTPEKSVFVIWSVEGLQRKG